MIKKINILLALSIIIFFSSCKSVDENRIYTKITPELIDIISKYEAKGSRNPAYSNRPDNIYINNTFPLIEYNQNNPADAKKIAELNFSNVLLSMPFEKKEGIVLDSLLEENNIMALSRYDFESWIKSAEVFARNLRKRGIKVYLIINLNKYRFNFRANIPLFTSAEYKNLSSSGRRNMRDYIIRFHKYLSMRLGLSGIFLENSDFLPASFIRDYCDEMKSYSGRGFLVSLFSKKDPLLQELLYKAGVGAVLDAGFSKRMAGAFSSTGSIASLTTRFGADALYRNAKRHIVFASLYEKGISDERVKDLICVFALTMPKVFIVHLDPDYYKASHPALSLINSFKKKYLSNAINIEHYKDDDVYIYSYTNAFNELFIALNKSSKRQSETVYLRLKKSKDLLFKDISGGPPVLSKNSILSTLILPYSLKAYYVRSKTKIRDLRGQVGFSGVSYSRVQSDIKIVKFTYRPLKRVKKINLVGDFNNWNISATPMVDTNGNGVYEVYLPLPKGRYSYKILIDGKKLVADYSAGVFEDDGSGGRKSVIIVR